MFTGEDGVHYDLETPTELWQSSYSDFFDQVWVYRAVRSRPSTTMSSSKQTFLSGLQTSFKGPPEQGKVAITIAPLTSSLQDSCNIAGQAFQRLLNHLQYRTIVQHPLLRSLFSVFLCNRGEWKPRRPEEVAELVTGCRHWTTLQDNATLLVVVEEYIDGCTILEYCNLLGQQRLVRSTAQLQRDAAAIVYQIAQLMAHLHFYGPFLCLDIPLQKIYTDEKSGRIRVVLPSSLTLMEDPALQRAVTCFDGVEHLLRAPEVRQMGLQLPAAMGTTSGHHCGADVWCIGVLLLQLCSVGHSTFSMVQSIVDRVAAVVPHLSAPHGILPPDVAEGVLLVLTSCLQQDPEKRPSVLELLTHPVFLTYKSHSLNEQNRAVIEVVETVKRARAMDAPPATKEVRQDDGVKEKQTGRRCSVKHDAATPWRGREVVHLPSPSAWQLSTSLSEVYAIEPIQFPTDSTSSGPLPLPVEPKSSFQKELPPSSEGAPGEVSSFLQRICEEVSDDFSELLICFAQLPTEQLLHPLSLTDATRIQQQFSQPTSLVLHQLHTLTKQMSELETIDPSVTIQFTEMLVESLMASNEDVEQIADTAILTEQLLRAASEAALLNSDSSETVHETSGESESDCLYGSTPSVAVPVTSQMMLLMPERITSSDTAVRTDAILYNKWVKKQQKSFSL